MGTKENKPLNRDGILTTIIYLAVIAIWIIPDIIKSAFPDVAAYISGQGVIIPCIFAIVLLCLIPKKEEDGCILTYEMVIQRVPWTLAIFAGTIMMFSTLINSEITGINVFLVTAFSALTKMSNPLILIVIGLLVVIILTNFVSNAVAQTVVFTVVASAIMASPTGGGLSLAALAVLIAIAAEIAFMTPAAAPCIPFIYNEGYIKVSDGLKVGFPIVIVCWVVLLVFWPIANAIM